MLRKTLINGVYCNMKSNKSDDRSKKMAKGTYISENLNNSQIALLKHLEGNEILYFQLNQLAAQLPERLKGNVNELVENLYQKALLNRVERGVYAKPNYSNVMVLATFISQNSAIGYWSALHYHGLTERFPNTVFVKTTQRKRATKILGSSIKFVSIKTRKNIGIVQEGYGDDSFSITDVDMTLVDCLTSRVMQVILPTLSKLFRKQN